MSQVSKHILAKALRFYWIKTLHVLTAGITSYLIKHQMKH